MPLYIHHDNNKLTISGKAIDAYLEFWKKTVPSVFEDPDEDGGGEEEEGDPPR